jgi:hypothetical protein
LFLAGRPKLGSAFRFPLFLIVVESDATSVGSMKVDGTVKNQKKRLNGGWLRLSASIQPDNYTLGWERKP